MASNVSDDISDYNISSLGELREIIIRFPSSHWVGGWLYRGQANCQWKLLPKAGRAPYHDNPRYDHRFLAWCREAAAYTKNFPKNVWERLALAQHHGLATNLLDWTSNPFVAAYFACAEKQGVTGAIYCYFPIKYVTKPELATLDAYQEVVAYQPRTISSRIINQKGCFTYHPDAQMPIYKCDLEKPFCGQQLKIIKIKSSSKQKILKELDLYGISYKLLFPNLDGLSSYYNWRTVTK